MTLIVGIYVFAMAFVLAQLEIQIEGPHGWAEKLPTWRWDTPGVRRWAGKPITGYHVYLMAFILLFVHLPVVYLGFSWEREAELLSLFCLLSVFWDFLWFVCNPHFGLARFRSGEAWWFPSWFLGLPTPYTAGLLASAAVYAAAGVLPGSISWAERATRWGTVTSALLVPTIATVAVSWWMRRNVVPAAPPARD